MNTTSLKVVSLVFAIGLLACSDSRSDKVEKLCDKICSCFEGSGSSSFSGSGGSCSDECVDDTTGSGSGGSGFSGSGFSGSGNGLPSHECLDCLLESSCSEIFDGDRCSVECDGSSGS